MALNNYTIFTLWYSVTLRTSFIVQMSKPVPSRSPMSLYDIRFAEKCGLNWFDANEGILSSLENVKSSVWRYSSKNWSDGKVVSAEHNPGAPPHRLAWAFFNALAYVYTDIMAASVLDSCAYSALLFVSEVCGQSGYEANSFDVTPDNLHCFDVIYHSANIGLFVGGFSGSREIQ